jgi:hypothetical protein
MAGPTDPTFGRPEDKLNVPAIREFVPRENVDARHKAGHDVSNSSIV